MHSSTAKLPSRADCPLIWDPQPSETPWASSRSVQGSLCLFLMHYSCLTASDHLFSFLIMFVYRRTAMYDTQEISTKRTRNAWQMFCCVSFNVCRKDKRKNRAAVQAKQACSSGRGISQPIHVPGTRLGRKLSAIPWPLYPLEIDPLPIVREHEWASGPVWVCPESIASRGFELLTPQPVTCY